MTVLPYDVDRPSPLHWRARVSAGLRQLWHVMRTAHHERVPY